LKRGVPGTRLLLGVGVGVGWVYLPAVLVPELSDPNYSVYTVHCCGEIFFLPFFLPLPASLSERLNPLSCIVTEGEPSGLYLLGLCLGIALTLRGGKGRVVRRS
jgi:hypothetical protein